MHYPAARPDVLPAAVASDTLMVLCTEPFKKTLRDNVLMRHFGAGLARRDAPSKLGRRQRKGLCALSGEIRAGIVSELESFLIGSVLVKILKGPVLVLPQFSKLLIIAALRE
jgi:hypothetical protein